MRKYRVYKISFLFQTDVLIEAQSLEDAATMFVEDNGQDLYQIYGEFTFDVEDLSGNKKSFRLKEEVVYTYECVPV